jgi:DNA-binding transcriptional MocR family regulator
MADLLASWWQTAMWACPARLSWALAMVPPRANTAKVDQRAGVAAALDRWRERDGPLAARLASALARAIEVGELAPVARLPSERALARSLRVSRGTVAAAYAELRARALVERRQGSGTRVRGGATASPAAGLARNPVFRSILERGDEVAPGPIDLTVSRPGPPPEAVLDALAAALDDLRALDDGLGYLPRGLPALRTAIAARLTLEGVPTGADQVLVTNGAQQAIALLARLLVGAGDPVLIESPTYIGALDAVAQAGGQLVGLDLLGSGSPGTLVARAADRSGARLLYLTVPNTPTGAVPCETWRRDLAAGAARAGVAVIEDATLAHLVLADPPPRPLAALRPGGDNLLVGSASKLWWGGLRVGWVRAPVPIVEQLGRLRAVADLGGALLPQAAVARLLAGTDEARTDRQVRLRAALETFASALSAALPAWGLKRPDAGLSLWVALPSRQAEAIADAAGRHGVRVVAGTRFSPAGEHADRLRLQFVQPPEVVAEAVARLATAAAESAAPDAEPSSSSSR